MSVTNATIKAIGAVLDLDAGATAALKAAVTRVLSEDTPKSVEEGEAARLIDVSRSTLYQWRNGTWGNAPHEFIFRIWKTPADETRYDKDELLAYNELRQVMYSRETPQPVITRHLLLNYLKVFRSRDL